jgi:DNA-binding NarL/FixJ family response regulator
MVNVFDFPSDTCPRHIEECHVGLPRQLRAIWVESSQPFVVVTFSLAPVKVLTRAELQVARLATWGHSNADIAKMRGSSRNTGARQMAVVLSKLGLGSRLGLATLPELGT